MSNGRTEQIFAYFLLFRAQYGVSPTVREVQAGLDIRSTSVVHYHLELLVEAGRLRPALPGQHTRNYVPA